MRVIFTLFFLLISVFLFGQNDKNVLLKIDKVSITKDSTRVDVELINCSKEAKVFYKIDLKDICTSVLKVYAIDSLGNGFNVFPCEAIIDLESIYLDCNNTITLDSNEGYTKALRFSNKDFSPYLKRGKYKMCIELNFSIGNFETEMEDIFMSDLITEKYDFKY